MRITRLLLTQAFIALYILLSLWFLARFALVSHLGDSIDRTPLQAMIDGTAYRPFVYRLLIPKLTGFIVALTPEGMQDYMSGAMQSLADSSFLTYFPTIDTLIREQLSHPATFYSRMVMLALVYVCLWGYIIALRNLANFFWPQEPAMAWLAPVFGLILAGGCMYPRMFIYDIPGMCFAAAAYAAMARRRFEWYMLWFLLACLNKETAIFLLIFYALWHARRLDRSTFLTNLLIQGTLYLTVRIGIVVAFRDNRGVLLENHVYAQIATMLTLHGIETIILFFSFLFMLTCRWREKPLFLRYVLWLFPMLWLAYIFYGSPGEYRVFMELFPLLTLLITHTLVKCTGLAESSIFTSLNRR